MPQHIFASGALNVLPTRSCELLLKQHQLNQPLSSCIFHHHACLPFLGEGIATVLAFPPPVETHTSSKVFLRTRNASQLTCGRSAVRMVAHSAESNIHRGISTSIEPSTISGSLQKKAEAA